MAPPPPMRPTTHRCLVSCRSISVFFFGFRICSNNRLLICIFVLVDGWKRFEISQLVFRFGCNNSTTLIRYVLARCHQSRVACTIITSRARRLNGCVRQVPTDNKTPISQLNKERNKKTRARKKKCFCNHPTFVVVKLNTNFLFSVLLNVRT